MVAPVVRPEWREVLQEWSTRLWVLALSVAGLNEQFPDLMETLAMGLSPDTINKIAAVIAVAGVIAKFAPQRALQRRADKRRAEYVRPE